MDRPMVDVADPEAVAIEEIGRHPVLGQDRRHLRREVHPEAEIGHFPGHVVEGGPVGERSHVDHLQTRGGRVDGHGCGGVREDGVGDDLVHVVGGG